MLRNLLERRLVWGMMGFGLGVVGHCWVVEICPWLANMCRCCVGG